MKAINVKAVKMLDIYDKEQLYIVIGEGEKKVVINVGEKNFEKVKKLTEDEQQPVRNKVDDKKPVR